MSEQIKIKSSEILQEKQKQHKDAIKLSAQEQALIEKYSEKILQIINLNELPENLPDDLVEFLENHKGNYLEVLRDNVEQSKYESFSDIKFEEVKEAVNNAEIIEIEAKSDEFKENVKTKLQDYLKEHNWWLQDYWREKGFPKEQFTITTEVGDIQIYNFSEALTERHLQELENLIQIFAQAKDQSPLKEIKYILLDDVQRANPNTGEDMNGYGASREEAIKLYPRGQKFIPHRIPEASNFEGTVIHELAHAFSIDLINKWSKAFGWKMLEMPAVPPM